MRTFLLFLSVGLTGCASNYREPDLPANHPANPSAESAVMPHRSMTLAITAQERVAPSLPNGAMHEGHGSDSASVPRGHGDAEGRHRAPTPSDPALYACPMHPEVTADKPGMRCPKCGMALVPHEDGARP